MLNCYLAMIYILQAGRRWEAELDERLIPLLAGAGGLARYNPAATFAVVVGIPPFADVSFR